MKVMRVCGFLLTMVSSVVFGISEKNYKETMELKVKPFYKEHGNWGKFKSTDGTLISHVSFINKQKNINLVILPGWTEGAYKYMEIAYDLYKEGISTHIIEWRGQGFSERPLSDPEITYVKSFDEYVYDLETYIVKVLQPKINGPLFALAHSMGANIACIYLSKNKGVFSGIILSSPMLDIRTYPYPEWAAWSISRVMEVIGFGDRYVPNHGPFVFGDNPMITTNSDVRHGFNNEYKRDHPEIRSNGASYSWLRAGLEATWFMKDNAHAIEVPILMLQSGKDLMVETEGQDEVCAKARNCQKVTFPNGGHELLNEVDSIREKAKKELIEYVKRGL